MYFIIETPFLLILSTQKLKELFLRYKIFILLKTDLSHVIFSLSSGLGSGEIFAKGSMYCNIVLILYAPKNLVIWKDYVGVTCLKKKPCQIFLWLSSTFLTLLAKADFMLAILKDVCNAGYPLSGSGPMKLAQCRWQRVIPFMLLYIPNQLSEMRTNFPVDWIKCPAQHFEATKYDRR